jgi:hypothetical protein
MFNPNEAKSLKSKGSKGSKKKNVNKSVGGIISMNQSIMTKDSDHRTVAIEPFQSTQGGMNFHSSVHETLGNTTVNLN